MLRLSRFRKAFLYCLILLLIYPSSPVIFKKLISLKEPAFICPLHIKEEVPIRSDVMGNGRFGATRSGERRRHRGLDIAGGIGEPVFAAKSGFVATGEVPGGMGRYIRISHFDGYVTIYGHLNSIVICDKSWAWQGQKIGDVGKSGNASHPGIKPHLHFEIRINGEPQDPLPYITIDKRGSK